MQIVKNALSYRDAEWITTVKSVVVEAQGGLFENFLMLAYKEDEKKLYSFSRQIYDSARWRSHKILR